MTTVNGTPAFDFRHLWPVYGCWRTNVTAQSGDPLAIGSTATVVAGTMTLTGKVLRSDEDAPGRPHSVIVGGLGWQSKIETPFALQSDSGIRLKTVLTQLAAGAGETIAQPPDVTIGNYYECVASRPGEPLTWADALNELYRSGLCPLWRVDADGVTRFGARTASEVTDRATQILNDSATGCMTYGLDDPVQFLPGNTIGGKPIGRVELRERGGRFEADVYTTESPSVPDLVRRMIRAELESRLRTYVVHECHADGRCDLAPLADARHLPELRNVEQWTIGGIQYRASKGDEVAVAYLDARKTRPRIIGFKLNGSSFIDAAMKGGTVDVLLPPMIFNGTIDGRPAVGVVTSPAMKTLGTISDGSTKAGIVP